MAAFSWNSKFSPVALQWTDLLTFKEIEQCCDGFKMAMIVPKMIPVKDIGVNSLGSKFQPYSSSNSRDLYI